MIKFRCLSCVNELVEFNAFYQCPACGNRYPIEDGIVCFSDNPFYYTDLNREEMQAFIRKSKESGWLIAVLERFSDNDFVTRIIVDETRADWQYLLPLTDDSVVLDIGAGWGTLTVPLARNFKQVVALEGTKDRLQFLNIRTVQEGLSNVVPVHADLFSHPFEMGQFDLVSFNGVLEWVGVGEDPAHDPRDKQLRALKIAYDLLKDGGYLYIGIENAQGIKYLLGEPDDHTGIPYITYVDRSEADNLNLRVHKRKYQTYTYSMAGYRELLSETQFEEVQFFYPAPDYKRIESIHNLNHDNVSRFLNNQQRHTQPRVSRSERVYDMEKILIDNNLLNLFAASFSIIARKVVR